MRRKPASKNMANPSTATPTETKLQTFERVLSGPSFDGLKPIFAALSSDREALSNAVNAAHSYEELLSRLGYRITLTNQIHVQDCYARVGPKGGIKAVLPYYDIPTQGSLPTLVNFDSTVTTTPKAAGYFNKTLLALKAQLTNPA
jgi:hypothetical protein